MKLTERLTGPLLKLALPTAARHVVAALGGWLAVSPGAGMMEYVAAALAMLMTTLWSWMERGEPNPDTAAMIRNLARALASQAMAFLAGLLIEHGYTGDMNDTVGILVWTGNFAHSVATKKKVEPREPIAGRSASDRPDGLGKS